MSYSQGTWLFSREHPIIEVPLRDPTSVICPSKVCPNGHKTYRTTQKDHCLSCIDTALIELSDCLKIISQSFRMMPRSIFKQFFFRETPPSLFWKNRENLPKLNLITNKLTKLWVSFCSVFQKMTEYLCSGDFCFLQTHFDFAASSF